MHMMGKKRKRTDFTKAFFYSLNFSSFSKPSCISQFNGAFKEAVEEKNIILKVMQHKESKL